MTTHGDLYDPRLDAVASELGALQGSIRADLDNSAGLQSLALALTRPCPRCGDFPVLQVVKQPVGRARVKLLCAACHHPVVDGGTYMDLDNLLVILRKVAQRWLQS
jgi:hypothetical protein